MAANMRALSLLAILILAPLSLAVYAEVYMGEPAMRQRSLLQVHEGCPEENETADVVCCTMDGRQNFAWVANSTVMNAPLGTYSCHDHEDDEEHVDDQIIVQASPSPP